MYNDKEPIKTDRIDGEKPILAQQGKSVFMGSFAIWNGGEMKPKALQRERMVTMRVSEREKEIIKAAAAKLNKPVSHLVYNSVMDVVDTTLNHTSHARRPETDRK